MRLSENFTLDEFLRSEAAARHGIDMTPPPQVQANIERLVTDFMQPIRTALDAPVRVTSGYRPTELNNIIGGSKTSAHRFGRACDFYVPGWQLIDVCRAILDMNLDYDQLILEFNEWIHLGIAELPRRQNLTAVREDGKTRYIQGIEL